MKMGDAAVGLLLAARAMNMCIARCAQVRSAAASPGNCPIFGGE